MGCEKSKPLPNDDRGLVRKRNGDSERNPGYIFSDIQIDIIQSTWPLVAEDMPGNGASVFLDIFATEPSVKNLFPFKQLQGDKLLKHPLFMAHSVKFMQSLDVVCETLPTLDHDCPIGRRLMVLGAQHATIAGFDIVYVSIFAKCMHLTWERVLGEEYTEDVKEAWTRLFEYVMDRIRDGYVLFNEEEQNKTAKR